MSLIYAGILLLSSAVLLFEITLTRVFSVAQWYHFSFMVVSLALLGFGASGSLISLFPGVARRNLAPLLAVLCLGFAVSCLVGYMLMNFIPFDSFRVGWESRQLLYLIAYYVSLAIPFLFAGLALGAALSQMPSQAGTLYGFNLIGSGLGCLLVLIGPPLFGGAGTVILASLLGVVAACVFWLTYSKALSAFGLVLGIGLVFLLIYLRAGLEIKMSPYKDLMQVLRQPAAKTLWTQWNAFSRVDVVDSAIHVAPGLSFACQEALPSQIGIAVDGENLSPISQISAERASFTEYLPSALAYYLSPTPRVLVIEPQGGLDVLTALHHNSASVVAVVSNPLVAEAVESHGQEGRGVFTDPRVRVTAQGARSYLSRSPELFDVVQLSLTDSFKVVAAGSYGLSENFLYTVEAFKQYYEHLATDGFLSITRWTQVPPTEEIRLCSVTVTALEELGVDDVAAHIIAIRSFQTITLLVKQSAVSPEDIGAVKDFCRQRQFDLVYFPGIGQGDLNRYNVLPEEVYYQAFTRLLSPSERDDFIKSYPYDVSATSDNRPFFFHFFKWSQAPEVLRNLGRTWQPFGGLGFLIVVALLVIAIIASALFILLPLAFGLKPESTARRRIRWRVFAYFGALGMGYLFIEIPLMQRFIGFLDQPTYSFAIVLFTILVCSGLGSLASGRLAGILPQALLLLALLAAFYPMLIYALFEALLGLALPFRLLLAIAVLAPLSFLMGIPFPSGIRLVGRMAPELVAWAWGINGCASVISSILAMILALSWGFSWVLVGAGIAYGLALAVIYTWAGTDRGRYGLTFT